MLPQPVTHHIVVVIGIVASTHPASGNLLSALLGLLMDGIGMGTKHRNGLHLMAKGHSTATFGISRSCLGRLRVLFDGGPSYPEMVDTLQKMCGEYGHLVKRGEKLTASKWLQRIKASGARLTLAQLTSVSTLMSQATNET